MAPRQGAHEIVQRVIEQGAAVEKPKGGRPPFVPTPEQRALVERLAALFVPQRRYAAKHFRAEQNAARTKVGASLKLRILRHAEAGSHLEEAIEHGPAEPPGSARARWPRKDLFSVLLSAQASLSCTADTS